MNDFPNKTNIFDTFNACKVRQNGDMICLTDMWKANGQPPSKRPTFWQRLPATTEMVDQLRHYLEQKSDVRKSHITSDAADDPQVIETRHGHYEGSDDPGSTWAHWQLAMVYAHYLSPAFYIWCNSIIYKMMISTCHLESTGLAPRFEDNFERIHKRFDQMAQHAVTTLILVSAIQKRQDGTRNDFKARSRRLILKAVAHEQFDGQCPCCTRVQVAVTTDGVTTALPGAEYDHFYGPALNRPEHGWLICQECHRDLTASPMLRFAKIPDFCAFSGYVLDEIEIERGRHHEAGTDPHDE
jgi:hypothetical protein